MSKITDYYKPSYSLITTIAMKLNILSVKQTTKFYTLKQKLITDYYKKINLNIEYGIPGQYAITKYFKIIK
jgi:hypothetical protein